MAYPAISDSRGQRGQSTRRRSPAHKCATPGCHLWVKAEQEFCGACQHARTRIQECTHVGCTRPTRPGLLTCSPEHDYRSEPHACIAPGCTVEISSHATRCGSHARQHVVARKRAAKAARR